MQDANEHRIKNCSQDSLIRDKEEHQSYAIIKEHAYTYIHTYTQLCTDISTHCSICEPREKFTFNLN